MFSDSGLLVICFLLRNLSFMWSDFVYDVKSLKYRTFSSTDKERVHYFLLFLL